MFGIQPISAKTRIVSALGLGQLLAWASSFYLIAVLGPAMAASFALPKSAVLAMFSGALLVSAVLGPFVGHRIDRVSGKRVLQLSNLLFALALLVMALARSPVQLSIGWLLMGIAMPFGLYDAAFATAVRYLGVYARRHIVSITLIAGFASSVSWPFSHFLEQHYGWRFACAVWALLHLTLGAGIYGFGLPSDKTRALLPQPHLPQKAVNLPAKRITLIMLGGIFALSGFVFSALAAHLPAVLKAAGCTPSAAIAAASIVGICQVAGRLLEVGYLGRLHPFVSATVACLLHPLAAIGLLWMGAPAALFFTVLHGAGVGLMTIVKGTLPLTLFGAHGFGRRAGLLEVPSKLAQASAPLLFSLWLEDFGIDVLRITTAITVVALCLVFALIYQYRHSAHFYKT